MKRFVFIIGLFSLSFGLKAQSYQLHSVFMYSFTRYMQWPEEQGKGDFEILVLGDSPILQELKKMATVKKVGERAIKVEQINSATEIRKCNILFVGTDKSAQFNEILSKVGTSSTLLITEQMGLASKGSGINFITKDGKLAFELNQAALNKHRLKASTELTRLAIVI